MTDQWRLSAACRGVDPLVFFPAPPKGNDHDIYRAARAICGDCPVRLPCLTAALDEETKTLTPSQRRWGMRGGATPTERQQLVREAS